MEKEKQTADFHYISCLLFVSLDASKCPKSISLHWEKSMFNLFWPLATAFGNFCYGLGSRFWVNETSQFLDRYSDQMQTAMKQKSLLMLGQMYFSMIEYSKHDWHASFGHKRLCFRRATAGTFILNLFYWYGNLLIWNSHNCIILLYRFNAAWTIMVFVQRK